MRLLDKARLLKPDHPVLQRFGRLLGVGASGEVYAYYNKAVKISVTTTAGWAALDEKLTAVSAHRNPSLVKLFGHDSFGALSGYTYYYVVMEQLEPIIDDAEGENVCTRATNALTGTDYEIPYPESIVDRARLDEFRRALTELPFDHNDIHAGNVMRARDGKLRLIDVESLCLRPV